MKKPTILFYGNCQLCAISKYINKYITDLSVVPCTECGLVGFSRSDYAFCVWSTDNIDHQESFKDCIHQKISEVDYFVYQHHGGSNTHDLLKTNNLLKIANESNTSAICVHNYLEYDIYPEFNWLVEYCLSKNITQPVDIDNYLKTNDDEFFHTFLDKGYETSRERNKNWEIRMRKENNEFISMNDYITSNYKKKVLGHTINHPTEFFLGELIERILKRLNITHDEIKLDEIDHLTARTPSSKYPFYKKHFPNIEVSNHLPWQSTLKQIQDCIGRLNNT